MPLPSSRVHAVIFVSAAALLLASVAAEPLRAWVGPGAFEGTDVREEVARARRAFVDATEAWDVLEHRGVHRAPVNVDLLRPDALHPQTTEAPLADLQWLYDASRTCAFSNPHASQLHPRLRKALRWHRFLCGLEPAPDEAFFAEPPLLHPGGGTFADAALRSAKPPFTTPQWRRILTTWSHVRERTVHEESSKEGRFLSWFALLSEDEAKAFLEGARTLVAKHHVALSVDDVRGSTTRVYAREAWDDFFRGRALVPTDVTSTQGAPCLLREDAVCWTLATLTPERRAAQAGVAGGVVFVLLVASGLAFLSLFERERKNREQIFMLRMLSHELRTPLTVMSLAAETLRERFDALDERGQRDLLVMLAETQKLTRIVRGSGQALLSAVHGRKGVQALPCVVDVVAAALEPFEAKIEVVLPEGPVPFGTDPFWLGLCVSNLVRNALTHGAPPVKATLVIEGKRLAFQVVDAGTFEAPARSRFAPFRKGAGSAGLGLGLSIVARKAKDLGGTLAVSTNPTTFTLNLKDFS